MGPLPAVQTASKHEDKVRMLVLETDETHPDTQKEIGGFGEVFNALLVKAGDDHDPPLGIETMMQYIVEPDGGHVPGPQDIPEDLHAILITGSEWDAHGDDEWIHKLMDFIKCKYIVLATAARSVFFSPKSGTLTSTRRHLDTPSRHQIHWHLLWPPDSLPNTRLQGRARTERPVGAVPHRARPV